MRKLRSCLIPLVALLPATIAWGQAAAPSAPAPKAPRSAGLCAPVSLFSDDFSRFPPGWLSKPVGTLNAAIQEYHYLPHRGVPTKPWANAICHLDAWVAGDEDGVPYLEQHSVADLPDFTVPDVRDRRPRVGRLHGRGEDEAAVAAALRRAWPSATRPTSTTTCSRWPAARRRGWWCAARSTRPTATASGATIATQAVRLRAEQEVLHAARSRTRARSIRAYVDGKLVIEASDEELKGGKVGLAASTPARYQAVKVTACPPTKHGHRRPHQAARRAS